MAAEPTLVTFTFTFSMEELAITAAALRKLPFETSAPIILRMEAQLQKMRAEAATATRPEEPIVTVEDTDMVELVQEEDILTQPALNGAGQQEERTA